MFIFKGGNDMDRVVFCPKCAWIGCKYDDVNKEIEFYNKQINLLECPSCKKSELMKTNIPASECEFSFYDPRYYEFRRKLFKEIIEPLNLLDKNDNSYKIWFWRYFEGGDKEAIKDHEKAMDEIKSGDFNKYIKDTPKCPTCNSTNLQKISTGNKVGSAALFGVFAIGHISKTYKCLNCGYKW